MTALEMLKQKRLLPPVVEENQDPQDLRLGNAVGRFFSDCSPALPSIPASLQGYELMHRHAALNGLPNSGEVVNAIHAAADCKRRSGLLWQACLDELDELQAEFNGWLVDQVAAGDDPYEETR